MQLLARDGISAAQEGADRAIMVERVLMMPSSRIEVAIDRNASEGLFDESAALAAVLKTYGYYTGGDAWPRWTSRPSLSRLHPRRQPHHVWSPITRRRVLRRSLGLSSR
ncbi:hypothetical protein XI09_14230 [Bradyrhizobium sp. CCBAU 11386]|nr:hypothetical protein [Bradyrhizobium sp. CCBAU 11386]